MPTNISGRVTLIVCVLWVALSCIFPSVPPSLFWMMHPTQQISLKPALKPGIDMVGGTSLLYEIKVPPGGFQGNLAEQVMNSLKERVDPSGVRNLIWRPQGNTRLEIQMPLNETTKETKAIRARFDEAQQALQATNVRIGEVRYAVEELPVEQSVQRLKELEHGSETRANILSAMRSTWAQIVKARAETSAADEARAQLQYDKLLEQLDLTNLLVSDLQTVLDLKPEAKAKGLAELKERFKDFPARLAAMDQFIVEYAQYSVIKGNIDDAAELAQLLRGSGVIEFHILANDLPQAEVDAMTERLLRRGPRPQANDNARWYEVGRSLEVIEQVNLAIEGLRRATDDRERLGIMNSLAPRKDSEVREFVRSLIANINDPATVSAMRKRIEDSLLGIHPLVDYAGKKWALAHITPNKSLMRREGQPEWNLQQAAKQMFNGQLVVTFEFDPQGARQFGDLTGSNIDKPLAILLDDKMISAPNINQQITSNGQITGGGANGFTDSEATYLVNTLNAGALPAQLAEEPISERTVGPNIGKENLERGLYACAFGLVVVAVFLIGYYYVAGVVATVAVLLNMVLILGSMAALNATFTLPGIAGIVLTIGMAVDANVLIFERLREEQVRGLSLRMALRNAYDRAFSAILDGNVTTAITAAALYLFGSEEVRGFGLTLLLGILSSMFTALYVTKTIFATLVDRVGVQKLSSLPLTFPKWDRLLRPNIDWMSKAWIFYAFSSIFIVGGLTLFGIRWAQGQMMDIEFASGTAVQFELKEQATRDGVQGLIEKGASREAIPSPTVVTVGDDKKTYELVTPNNNALQVREAIVAALGDKLNITLASKYEMMDRAAGELLDQAIFPIDAATTSVGGRMPANLRKHLGGVAIILKNVDPPLGGDEIKKRLAQQRLQAQTGASGRQYADIEAETFDQGRTAVILASIPELTYDKADLVKQQQWMDELVAPTWNLARDAINKPEQMQKVTNFDAQIAGETQTQAFIALTLSIIAIMAYIWVRFGDLKYGTATVVALLHDTLFTLAAVGVAHYVAGTWFGDAVLLEPFRVNLNLVAAVLTIMGYSMNDTVVVFDRIRENRGKFGHVDRVVVNDSINQTLSRTLLTGGTTILTIFVMYIFGGPGIHGFTFALLVGIVVGTYSSIAIAAPILLIGVKDAQTSQGKPVGQRQLQGA